MNPLNHVIIRRADGRVFPAQVLAEDGEKIYVALMGSQQQECVPRAECAPVEDAYAAWQAAKSSPVPVQAAAPAPSPKPAVRTARKPRTAKAKK